MNATNIMLFHVAVVASAFVLYVILGTLTIYVRNCFAEMRQTESTRPEVTLAGSVLRMAHRESHNRESHGRTLTTHGNDSSVGNPVEHSMGFESPSSEPTPSAAEELSSLPDMPGRTVRSTTLAPVFFSQIRNASAAIRC